MVLIVFQNNHYSSAMANIIRIRWDMVLYIYQKALRHNDTNLMKASVHREKYIFTQNIHTYIKHRALDIYFKIIWNNEHLKCL